jgi:hypothetical protein
MGEDDNHTPIRRQSLPSAAEGSSHTCFILFFPLSARGGILVLLHKFIGFGGEGSSKDIQVSVAHGAVQPDIEEVGEVGVRDSIIVGWIGDDGIYAVIEGASGRLLQDDWNPTHPNGYKSMLNIADHPIEVVLERA